MSEKLPFSPYPPRPPPPRSQSSTIRWSRRRLLPFLLLAILSLIYFSRTTSPNPTTESPHEAPKTNLVSPAHFEAAYEQISPGEGSVDTPAIAPVDSEPIVKLHTSETTFTTSAREAYTHIAEPLTTSKLIPTAIPKTLPSHSTGAEKELVANNTRIMLDAHIMSKCPDARDCLREMVVPAMEQISELVRFNLSFVQTIEADGSVKCKHGPAECLGDTLILCAQSLYPDSAVRSLGFANCMIKDYKDIPHRAHVQNCALEHGVDFDKLNDCASDSDRGDQLLKKAVKWTRGKGVKYSCTVRVDGEKWCVRDGGEWKECEGGSSVDDLVNRVKKLAGHDEDER